MFSNNMPLSPYNTIYQLRAMLDKKEVSAQELKNYYLQRIKKHNTSLNAFLTDLNDVKTFVKTKSDLQDIPYAIKDVFMTKGIRTTASSKMLNYFIAPYESTTTQRVNISGAIPLGKTNCDAFAFGASTENSGYGPTKNPFDITRTPGGSSGGSAAAVAAGLAPFALGTDTGGSIRQPASFCGIVGMKLTYSRASRYGLIAMASSFDTPGPMTRNVEDAALITKIISGYDPKDGTTVDRPVPDYKAGLQKSIKGKRIGVITQSYEQGVETSVKKALDKAREVFVSLGAIVGEVSLPKIKYGIPAYYILVPSEISSNMARFDTIRYGHQSDVGESLVEMVSNSRAEAFEDEVKRRIMLGNYALSSGYYDAYYMKAAKVRTLIKQEFSQAFSQYDALISPTSPTTAFKLGEKSNNPLAMYLADYYTCPVNIAGIPAISIPNGQDESGLPIGLQIIGDMFNEEAVLNIAYQFEQATPWHQLTPKGWED